MQKNYPIPLNGLRHFYWAAKLNSFKQAAATIHVSEAAVSQQIRNLEQTLGVSLFERQHQQVVLTDQGNRLFPYVQSAFNSLFDGIDAISADPQPNQLSLTTMPSFASHWLIGELSSFYQQYPELSISMDTSVEARDFEEGNYNLGIRYGQGTYPGLRSELLMHDPIVLVCHHKHLKADTITREDILRLPMIKGTFKGVDDAFGDFEKFYQFEEKQLVKEILLHDGGLGVEAARRGQGIAMQRLSLVIDLVESGELVYAKDYAFRDYNFYAVAPEPQFSLDKVQKFMHWLKTEMAKTQQRLAPHIAKIKH